LRRGTRGQWEEATRQREPARPGRGQAWPPLRFLLLSNSVRPQGAGPRVAELAEEYGEGDWTGVDGSEGGGGGLITFVYTGHGHLYRC
jgi:hypothetical protein